MDKECSTKDRILQEAMKLFAVNGFEAVSVRAIAAEVGVRDSALYKHYPRKQAIFDAIVQASRERFWNKYKEIQISHMEEQNLIEICLQMFKFQTEDEWIVRFRQLLIIEQFRNPDIAKIYKELFIDMPIENQAKIFEMLIEKKILKDKDAKVMSMELYAPFFMYHTIGDKPHNLEDQLRRHVENFKASYFIVDQD